MPNPAWMVFGSWQKCLAGSKPTHPGYKIVSQDAGLERAETGDLRFLFPPVFAQLQIFGHASNRRIDT